MFNLLVLGGTGFLGSSVCERLVERSGGGDGPITVPTRYPSRAKHILMLPTVEIATVDLFDDSRLARLVSGRDAVINLVGILHGSEERFRQVHVDLPTRVAHACRAAGVSRLIHVSALGADPSAPSKYLRSKAAGEAALRSSGQAFTIFRPSVMFGEHDRFMNRFAKMQAVLPFVPLAGADAQFQPVWVEDVARAITRSLDDPTMVGETLECAGPSVCTLKELVKLAGRWSGHERPVIALPDVLGRLQAVLLGILPGEPLLTTDNIDSMKVPNVASGKLPGLQRLGIAPTSIDTMMPRILSGNEGPARLEPLRALARRR